MAGGVLEFIEGLGKKGLTFLEKEIEAIDEEIEGIGDNKGVYPATFKGEVLEKYDPYEEDDGDHEAHGAETKVPAADQDAQWFPAVKKAGVSKIAAVAAPGAMASDANKMLAGSAHKALGDASPNASISRDTDTKKESSTFASTNPTAGAVAVNAPGGRQNTAGAGAPHPGNGSSARRDARGNVSDNANGAKRGSASDAGSNDTRRESDRIDGANETENAAHTSESIAEGGGASHSQRSNTAPHHANGHHANGSSARRDVRGNVSGNANGAKRSSGSDAGSNDTRGGSDRIDGANETENAAHTSESTAGGDGASHSQRSNTTEGDKSSTHASRKGSPASNATGEEEDKEDAHNASSAHSKTKKAHAAAFRKHDHHPHNHPHNHLHDHPHASDNDTAAADNGDKNTAEENGNEQEKSPRGESANTLFDKKAPSLIADLDDLSEKGKKAKIRKETLRGAKRTLQKPHKLFKDPERLAAARSGDPEAIKHSLKRHGRVIVPRVDADPKDIRADPDKLKSIRSNPNKAIRSVIDMGQQYGMDPFEGIDPADVQDIIEYHAAEHPHRKHKVPYVPPAVSNDDSENVEELDTSDSGIDEDTETATGTFHNRRKKSKKEARKHTDVVDRSHDSYHDSSQDDMDEEDNGDDNDDDDAPSYPKLEDAAELDLDDPNNGIARRKKNNKKKRSYPKPYCNNQDPSDLQLACDSLSAIASSGDDERWGGDKDKVSDEAPLHKKKAHAAKKMLKCLNRVRSFQQDPAACEGAFVDEAADAGAVVAGLSPNDIEKHYYALKAVSEKYNALSDPKDSEESEDDADSGTDDEDEDENDADSDTDEDDDEDDEDDESDNEDYNDDEDDKARDPDEDSDEDDYHPLHRKKKSHRKSKHASHSRHRAFYDDESSGDDYHPLHRKKKSHRESKHASHSRHRAFYTDTERSNGYGSNVIINQNDIYTDTPTPDIEMSLPSNQFPNTTVSSDSTGAMQSADPSMEGLIQDPTTGTYYYQDPTTGEYYVVDPTTGECYPADSDEEGEQGPDGNDGMSSIIQMGMGFLSSDEGSTLLQGVSSLFSGENEQETEKAAESIEDAVSTLSKAEGELAEVESLGSEASSASSKIKGLKGARANYAKMINLCSNPMDDVTEAENTLSMVDELAQHPDAVINQADALINAAQQGIGALANAQSPEDAMTALMGIAAQMSNGGGGDEDDSQDDDSDAAVDPNTGLAIDPDTGLEFDPATGLAFDPATGAVIDPTTGAVVSSETAQPQLRDNDHQQAVPAEFANADMYGDE